MRALQITLNGIDVIDVENDLHALQKAVGGHIETVGLKDGGVMNVKRFSKKSLDFFSF